MKIAQFSRPPPSLVHLHSKFVHSMTLESNFKQTPAFPMITNQLKEHIFQRGLLYIIRSFVQVSLRFQYELINLSGFPLTYFHIAKASLSVFSRLYTHVCAVVQKYHEMYFTYKYSYLKYKPILLSTCFISITWKRKQTMKNNCAVHVKKTS